ncbi:MAG: ribulose-phosphate 3-epimerase [Treponema sp.]|nr:ribulose-phosphate 3-epimerase [Treponema sp.]
MTAKISPSMMCADIEKLREVLDSFKSAGIEYLHIDVMDGVFVPNYTLGTDYVKQLRRLSDIPLDIHLMIERPEDKISWFDPRPGEYFSVHTESTPHIHRALSKIREAGAKPMAAVNPGTHYRCIEHLLDYIDAVLVMCVNPGYAGQALIESSIPKIANLRRWLDMSGHAGIEIEVDGNVSFANAKRMREAGANIFVAGSSSVFSPSFSIPGAIAKLRDVIG